MKIGALLAVLSGCFVLGALLMAVAGLRVDAAAQRQRWIKFGVYAVIVFGVLGCTLLGTAWLVALAFVIVGVGAWELQRASASIAVSNAATARSIIVVYAILASLFVLTLLMLRPAQAAFLYVVVAAFDGFSQVVGQALGRHRLAPRLSPGKTVEGLIGGTAAALAIAWTIRDLAGLTTVSVLAVALVIASFALAGDLAASWVKRRAAIKDFSALLPGQGGVLDRFDSFIGTGALLAPLLWFVGAGWIQT